MGSIVDLTTAFDFEKEQSRKETCMMASRSWKYFPNFSLTKEFVDHPFLGRKEVKGKGSPQKDAWAPCRAKNDSISSSRLIASQEKDEGVSWSRQKNAAGVWGN